jgi:hypothetical protein
MIIYPIPSSWLIHLYWVPCASSLSGPGGGQRPKFLGSRILTPFFLPNGETIWCLHNIKFNTKHLTCFCHIILNKCLFQPVKNRLNELHS